MPHGVLRRADTDAEKRQSAVPLATFLEAASQGVVHPRFRPLALVLLLTLAAGWMDALCYLALDRTFASIMSGNIIFVGLSIAQRSTRQLVHAVVAVLLFLVGVTLGSRYLQTLPARQPVESWRRTLARYLLVEGLILLAFALVWSFTGNFAHRATLQGVLLGVAAFSLGLQGALFGAFNILDVNTVAITGTELLLGIRLAQRMGRQPAGQPGATTSVPFLAILLLSYALAGLFVALGVLWIGTRFIPCFLVAAAVVVLLTPARRGDR